ncbi:hypothetical protein ONZ45_g15320 [Pleurotus djamor]|nr:hypothetical protein ONZ45_g15320 [Pleurotus djamor]
MHSNHQADDSADDSGMDSPAKTKDNEDDDNEDDYNDDNDDKDEDDNTDTHEDDASHLFLSSPDAGKVVRNPRNSLAAKGASRVINSDPDHDSVVSPAHQGNRSEDSDVEDKPRCTAKLGKRKPPHEENICETPPKKVKHAKAKVSVSSKAERQEPMTPKTRRKVKAAQEVKKREQHNQEVRRKVETHLSMQRESGLDTGMDDDDDHKPVKVKSKASNIKGKGTSPDKSKKAVVDLQEPRHGKALGDMEPKEALSSRDQSSMALRTKPASSTSATSEPEASSRKSKLKIRVLPNEDEDQDGQSASKVSFSEFPSTTHSFVEGVRARMRYFLASSTLYPDGKTKIVEDVLEAYLQTHYPLQGEVAEAWDYFRINPGDTTEAKAQKQLRIMKLKTYVWQSTYNLRSELKKVADSLVPAHYHLSDNTLSRAQIKATVAWLTTKNRFHNKSFQYDTEEPEVGNHTFALNHMLTIAL